LLLHLRKPAVSRALCRRDRGNSSGLSPRSPYRYHVSDARPRTWPLEQFVLHLDMRFCEKQKAFAKPWGYEGGDTPPRPPAKHNRSRYFGPGGPLAVLLICLAKELLCHLHRRFVGSRHLHPALDRALKARLAIQGNPVMSLLWPSTRQRWSVSIFINPMPATAAA
jgi:hypothetical protein